MIGTETNQADKIHLAIPLFPLGRVCVFIRERESERERERDTQRENKKYFLFKKIHKIQAYKLVKKNPVCFFLLFSAITPRL